MEAGEQSCTCPHCGAVCTGRFGGCRQVWANPIVLLTPVARPAARRAGAVEQTEAPPVEPVTPPVPPADYEQLRAELVRAVSAAVEALGCRLEDEQHAQWQALREEIEKRLADLVIVSGEPGSAAGHTNGRRESGTPLLQSGDDRRLDQPTLDAGDPSHTS
jgi:hypothetical protein